MPRPRSCSPWPTRRRPSLALGVEGVKPYIKTVGLYNTKAENLVGLCQRLMDLHGGQVPADRASLEALPGVGPQDRQRRAEHGVRRGRDRGRYAYLPRRQPHRAGARAHAAARWRMELHRDHAAGIRARMRTTGCCCTAATCARHAPRSAPPASSATCASTQHKTPARVERKARPCVRTAPGRRART